MIRVGRLHILTDSALQDRWSHLDLARAAVENGAETVQYRRKDGSTRRMVEEAIALREICRRHHVPLLVNDRLDVALAADADGVHLGTDDLPIAIARDLLGPHKTIGGSSDTPAEAGGRRREGADYAGIGPVFATSSKADAGPVLGLDGLARAVRESRVPLIAIGGIDEANLAEVLATGVHGVALLGAVCLADDPGAVVARLREILHRARPTP
jgi:thiamine-phosphate pyrophosphorylase